MIMTFKEYWEEMWYLSVRVILGAYAKYHMHMSNYCLEASSNPASYKTLQYYKFRWKKYWGTLRPALRTMSVMSEALGKTFMQGMFTPKVYPVPEGWERTSRTYGGDA